MRSRKLFYSCIIFIFSNNKVTVFGNCFQRYNCILQIKYSLIFRTPFVMKENQTKNDSFSVLKDLLLPRFKVESKSVRGIIHGRAGSLFGLLMRVSVRLQPWIVCLLVEERDGSVFSIESARVVRYVWFLLHFMQEGSRCITSEGDAAPTDVFAIIVLAAFETQSQLFFLCPMQISCCGQKKLLRV